MKRNLFLLIGFLFLLFSANVFGYTINDNTSVGKGLTKSTNDNILGWVNAIGDEFDTYGIDLSQEGSRLTIDIYTDFSGNFQQNGLTLTAADLFLNLDGNNSNGVSGYELAIAFSGQNMGSIYNVTSAYTSKERLENIPNWYYGEYWTPLKDSPIVQIKTGNDTDYDATLKDSFPIALISNQADYLWSLTIDLANFDVDYTKEIGIFWATATCANDIIEGTAPVNPVPEPATMLLLGSGLIGLAGFGRKKLLK